MKQVHVKKWAPNSYSTIIINQIQLKHTFIRQMHVKKHNLSQYASVHQK